jgi:LPS-assembly lipoprotein
MSWPKRLSGGFMAFHRARTARMAGAMAQAVDRRTALQTLLALVLACPMLAACEGGFRPMYGSLGSGPSLEEKLAQVEFGTIPGRVGQRIRNELVFQGTGGGTLLTPTHRLQVTIRESVVSTLVRQDGESQSQLYNLDAKFQLVRLADKKVVLEGTSHGRAGFDRFSSIFSNVRAREDAENRAARTVAQDLKSRLGAYLSGEA